MKIEAHYRKRFSIIVEIFSKWYRKQPSTNQNLISTNDKPRTAKPAVGVGIASYLFIWSINIINKIYRSKTLIITTRLLSFVLFHLMLTFLFFINSVRWISVYNKEMKSLAFETYLNLLCLNVKGKLHSRSI